MSSGAGLRRSVVEILTASRHALSFEQLVRDLALKGEAVKLMSGILSELEDSGHVARNAKGFWSVPEKVGLLAGVIRFSRTSDTARLISRTGGQVLALIKPRCRANALNGDVVLTRVLYNSPERIHRRGWIPEARVIRILQRAQSCLTGILRAQEKGQWLVEPDDTAFGYTVAVAKIPKDARSGDRVRVVLEEWESALQPLRGRVEKIFGQAGTPKADRDALLARHDVRREFPEAVEREMMASARFFEKITADGREDYRWQEVITIDPEDAKDHDDAIYVERLSAAASNGWRVWVHIADVSHYVYSGSALDREAFARATSVYLPGEVIPMLPQILSNDLCSLRPEVDRFALSVRFDVSEEGEVQNASFYRSLIRVRCKLSYAEALEMLKCSLGTKDPICERVKCAGEAAQALRKRRFASGALNLEFPEMKIRVNAAGRPVRVEKIIHDCSHQLIEELMLAANEVVAAKLKNSGRGALYRVHEPPDPDRLLEFREFLCAIGIRVGNLSVPGEVQRMLAELSGREDEHALKIAFLRSLQLAVYHPQPLGHYGLAKTNYTHFTSPIRRYPDLVVHRCLGMLMGWMPAGPVAPSDLLHIAEHCSTRERVAAAAENESVRLAQVELLEAVVGTHQEAIVIEQKREGVVVQLVETGFEGFVSMLVCAKRRGRMVRSHSSLRGAIIRREGGWPRPGERMLVEIVSIDRERSDVVMKIVSSRG